MVLLATRERVFGIEDAQLVAFFIYFQLVSYIIFYRRCIFANCIDIVPFAPEFSVSICKFHVPKLLEYH